MVTEADHQIGEILKALDEAGQTNETNSDHGDFVGSHGMVEKAAAGQNGYEDILNIPMIRITCQNKPFPYVFYIYADNEMKRWRIFHK